jgi:phage terminase large subunit GpA-like protein
MADLRAAQRLARPDVWAEDMRLRVDGRPFDLSGREYIRAVIRDTEKEILVKKAAQTAFTITFLVRTFHWMVERRWHHLYLLPLKTGAVPFVQKRIDPMLASNEILNKKFASVDNRTHKQTNDDIALLIRGTNVESELQETPTDVVVFDEFDRMTQDFLADARHRTDGSAVKRFTYLSTPTVPGHGLDSEDMWHASDQHRWFVPCPHCSRMQSFTLDENVKIGDDEFESVFECQFCSKVISDLQRREANKQGVWDATNPAARKARLPHQSVPLPDDVAHGHHG